MSALVRIITLPDPVLGIRQHPHDGMIICPEHLRQIALDVEPTYDELPVDQVAFWRHRCLMCDVESVSDRVCSNADCGKSLHPQWPAVYCSNDCARWDS